MMDGESLSAIRIHALLKSIREIDSIKEISGGPRGVISKLTKKDGTGVYTITIPHDTDADKIEIIRRF